MRYLLLIPILALLCGTSFATIDTKILPDDEKALLNSVDPWGLAFGDQLTRFDGYFAGAKDAQFVAGVTHNLVKVWQNKYWFRGDIVPPGAPQTWKTQWAVTGGVAMPPPMTSTPTAASTTATASSSTRRASRTVPCGPPCG